jgi:hypothetical protein
MSITPPYRDARQNGRRTQDWLVTIRDDARVTTHRFASEQHAWAFHSEHDESGDDESPTRGTGSRA